MAFVLWPNIILFICVGIILSIIGYIIYGLNVGFENTLKEFENEELSCKTEEQQDRQSGEERVRDK